MPELPDIDVYVGVLNEKLAGSILDGVRLGNPFLLRSVEPPLAAATGRSFVSVRRIGKRIAIGLDGDLWLILHLMIAGRLLWHDTLPTLAAKNRIASLDFSAGSLLLTEAGSKKRASLHLASSARQLSQHDRGGIEPLECSLEDFRAALRSENHTLKRALTDPRLFSGIGNAYSDEILHAAKLSPVMLTSKLADREIDALYATTRYTLTAWRARLIAEAGGEIPKQVTAFRQGMAVHGRFGQPCPDCGQPVQRIRYKSNETNYCAACQTGSRILKDRTLSRLLKDDWPKSLDAL